MNISFRINRIRSENKFKFEHSYINTKSIAAFEKQLDKNISDKSKKGNILHAVNSYVFAFFIIKNSLQNHSSSEWLKFGGNLTSASRKNSLRKSFTSNPVFTSYIKALGFTLAKIELNIWTMYLLNSHLPSSLVEKAIQDFKKEYELTRKCYENVTHQNDLLWFRSWLGESIRLRSSMIHPLNLLQIIAKNNNDLHLLRVTTTGISSGMLTTG